MNLSLPFVPERDAKPRTRGVNMIMDKGLSCAEAESMVEVAGHLVDFVKLGFGTSAFSNNLSRKVAIYKAAGIRVYLGGTLFEACLIRDSMDEYLRFADSLGVDAVEVSDGSMILDHERKCGLITDMSSRFETVLSEVGSKVAGRTLSVDEWVGMMQRELAAGSDYVIAEARESGNVGVFDAKCGANEELINTISQQVPLDKILWEAPIKSQQIWFIKNFETHVNLGNISYNEVIALETLRSGLRGDTFGSFLPADLAALVQK